MRASLKHAYFRFYGELNDFLPDEKKGITFDCAFLLGYFVRAIHPRQQLREVVRHSDLSITMAPFRRCLRCNGLLQPARKQDVELRLPPRTRELFNEFHVCLACGRTYWKGSHYEHMQRLVNGISAQP
jgi:uncharacterized protein with PIN domain